MRSDVFERKDKNGLPFWDLYINGQHQGSFVVEQNAMNERDRLMKGVGA